MQSCSNLRIGGQGIEGAARRTFAIICRPVRVLAVRSGGTIQIPRRLSANVLDWKRVKEDSACGDVGAGPGFLYKGPGFSLLILVEQE